MLEGEMKEVTNKMWKKGILWKKSIGEYQDRETKGKDVENDYNKRWG